MNTYSHFEFAFNLRVKRYSVSPRSVFILKFTYKDKILKKEVPMALVTSKARQCPRASAVVIEHSVSRLLGDDPAER